VVLGVSPDPVKTQAKFKQTESLPFTLLADEQHAVAETYGVWVEKTNYGRKYWGVARTTFIIGPDGRIDKILHKVDPKTHSDQVLKTLAELTS
jgi:thioredoxin-dependent peroxiredoxin